MAARWPRAARRLSCWHMSDQDVRQMAPYPSRLELGPAANDQRSPFRAVRRVHTAGSWASRWSARACSSACLLERMQPPAGEPACAVGLGLGALSPQDPAQLDAVLVVAHQGLQVLGGAGKPLGGPAEGGRDGLCRVEGTFGGPLRVFVQELVASRTGATPSARPGKYAPGGLTRGALARPRPPRPIPAADPVSGRHGEPVSPINAGRQSTDRASDWSQLRLSARVHVSHRH